MNNVRCVMLGINRQPGTEHGEVVDKSAGLLPQFQRDFRRRCAWRW